MLDPNLIPLIVTGVAGVASITTVGLFVWRLKKEKAWQEELRDEMEKSASQARATFDQVKVEITTTVQEHVKALAESDKQVAEKLEAELKRFVGLAELHLVELEKVMDTKLQELKAQEERDLQDIRVTIDSKIHQGLNDIVAESNRIMAEKISLSVHATTVTQLQESLGKIQQSLRDAIQSAEVANRKSETVSQAFAKFRPVDAPTAQVIPLASRKKEAA